jgi:predicted kinase
MSKNFLKEIKERIMENNGKKWDNFFRNYDFDFIKLMDEPHDNPYHKESIAEHVKMCNDNIRNAFDNDLFGLEIYKLLSIISKYHDIGKPFVKVNGSYKLHNLISAGIFSHINVLSEIYTDKRKIYLIQYLINLHMLPHQVNTMKPKKLLHKLSTTFKNIGKIGSELFILFYFTDSISRISEKLPNRGYITTDEINKGYAFRNIIMEDIKFNDFDKVIDRDFVLYNKIHNKLNIMWAIYNEIFNENLPDEIEELDYHKWFNTYITSEKLIDKLIHTIKKTLIVPIGIQGAGKTYLRKKFMNNPVIKSSYINYDEIRNELGFSPSSTHGDIFKIGNDKIKTFLNESINESKVLFMDNTNINGKDRKIITELTGNNDNVNIIYLIMDNNLHTCYVNSQNRENNNVDLFDIIRTLGKLQHPSLSYIERNLTNLSIYYM